MIPTNWATEPWTTSMELRHGAPSSRRALMDHWQFCCVNYVLLILTCSHHPCHGLSTCTRSLSPGYNSDIKNLCGFSSVYIESSPHILKWTTIFDGNAMDDLNLFWPASQFASRLSFDKERNGKSPKLHQTLFAVPKKTDQSCSSEKLRVCSVCSYKFKGLLVFCWL